MSSSVRRPFRFWRWGLAALALLSLVPLYERRPGGPMDARAARRVLTRILVLVDRDPAEAHRLALDVASWAPASQASEARQFASQARLRLLQTTGSAPDGPAPDLPELAALLAEAARLATFDNAEVRAHLGAEAALPTPGAGASAFVRARAFFVAGRWAEAASAAWEAGEAALYWEAESLRRLGSPLAQRRAALLVRAERQAAAPLGHLVIGRALLTRGDPAGWAHVAEALPLLRSGWMAVHAAIDRDALHAELRERALAERDADLMRGPARVLTLWASLFPGDLAGLGDAADLAVRRASALAAAGRGDEARVARLEAADVYGLLARRREPDSPAAAHALRRRAEELFAAGEFAAAAEVFHGVPGREAAYYEGVALARAGLSRPALARLGVYVDSAPPGDALYPDALVRRARLLASEGDAAGALAELDRLFRRSDLSVGPMSDEWRGALLLKVRLHEARGEKAPARAALADFVTLYGPPSTGAPRGEVAFARAQLAVHEMEAGRWSEAIALLDRARAEMRAGMQPSELEAVDLAGVIAGEAYLGMDRPGEARLAFDAAAIALRERPGRIAALVGRARASLRLGLAQDAAVDYRRARALYDEDRAAAGPTSFAFLEGLRRELP